MKALIEKALNIEIRRANNQTQKQSILTINEAVNLENEVIFIAVPKTGTSSVRTQLKQAGKPIIGTPHLNILQVKDLIYIYLLKKNLGTNKTFPNENLLTDALIRAEANQIFERFFKFSAVRNPWARAVSLYFRREGVMLKDKMTFEAFCENHLYASDTCHNPTLHNNQYDWLCSLDGKILMDYIYKVEEFESAITKIKDMTNGRLVLSYVKRNQNPNSKSENYKSLYNDKTRKLIAKSFEKDIDYFKYTF